MSEKPVISVIMPTRNRPQFVEQALAYFHAQDYPRKELLIVDASDTPSLDLLASRPGVRYLWLAQPLTIGIMRNIACTLATGDIIAFGDDDDYFGAHRLSLQAQPLLDGTADVSAMKMSLVYHKPSQTTYRLAPDEHTRLFRHDCRAGTLMCWSRYWHAGLRFPDASRGEDVAFLDGLLAQGARLARLDDASAYVCVRHGGNVSDELEYAGNPHMTRVVSEQEASNGAR